MTRTKVTLNVDPCTFMTIFCWKFRWNFLRNRNTSDNICRENQTQNIFQEAWGFWVNVKKYGRSGQATDNSIIQHMRFSCWITKAIHIRIHNINTFCFTAVTTVSLKRLGTTLYIRCNFCLTEVIPAQDNMYVFYL
jgi:hypothetical protein